MNLAVTTTVWYEPGSSSSAAARRFIQAWVGWWEDSTGAVKKEQALANLIKETMEKD